MNWRSIASHPRAGAVRRSAFFARTRVVPRSSTPDTFFVMVTERGGARSAFGVADENDRLAPSAGERFAPVPVPEKANSEAHRRRPIPAD